MSDAAPLSSLRILSFGTAIAGNVTASLLAEWGADVVKIESPIRADPLRVRIYTDLPRVVEPTGAETNIMYASYSRSVRTVALDMKSAGDVETFLRLVAVADVLVENFATGVMERWGVGAERLREVNDRLVHLSISGYGRTGARAAYMAYGSNINAFVGLSRVWAPHGTQFDYAAVAHGMVAVLAALERRDRDGVGTYIDLAQTESGGAVSAPLYLDYLMNDRADSPDHAQVPGSLLSSVVPCRAPDTWLAIELEDASDWAVLCALLERPNLALDPGAREPDAAQRAALDGALTTWCGERPAYGAMLATQHAGLASSVVADTEHMFLDPQHRARGFIVEHDHPDLGRLTQPGPFHHFSRTQVAIRRPSPRLGQHTDQVVAEWLAD